MSNESLLALLAPVIERLKTLDVSDSQTAQATLNSEFPVDSEFFATAKEAFSKGLEEGWLCNREGGGAKFSRVAKPSDESANFSLDAVQLSGKAPAHAHTLGEVDLCIAHDGSPTFDGNPEGWVVYPPGSQHVPTVEGGTMNILYFLPEGKIEWL